MGIHEVAIAQSVIHLIYYDSGYVLQIYRGGSIMASKSNNGIGGTKKLTESSMQYPSSGSPAGRVAGSVTRSATGPVRGQLTSSAGGPTAGSAGGPVASSAEGPVAGSAKGSAAGSAAELGVPAVAESVPGRNAITELPKSLEGLVVRTGPGNYLVDTGYGTFFCKLKGSLKNVIRDRTDMPVIGDRVAVQPDPEAKPHKQEPNRQDAPKQESGRQNSPRHDLQRPDPHRQDLQISDSHRQDSHNRNSHETLQGQHSELQGPVSRLPGRNMQFAGVPVRGTGVISAIHPRKTRISRISPPADPWGAHLEQVLAVNVTQLVIVASCVAPPFKMGSIERYLMIARQSGVSPVVCVNKVDLLPQGVLEALMDATSTKLAAGDGYCHGGPQYEDECQCISKDGLGEDKCNSEEDKCKPDEDKCKPGTDESAISPVIQSIITLQRRGIPLILTSAETGMGVSELQNRLVGGVISVFLGPSGAGKTSLLKKICPDYESKTLEISSSTSKGRHSTTYSTLVDIGGGYVADTPGLRAIGLWQLDEETVKSEYEDIEKMASQCRFRDCSHTHEPGCAVKAAVAGGRLDARRFERYLKVMGETVRKRR